MFAFAILDKKKKILTLCRDRVGEKPLYYGFINDIFIFGSELGFLGKCFKNKLQIRKQSVYDLVKYNYIPTPFTIYKNFYKLSPASFLELNLNIKVNISETIRYNEKKYWVFKKINNEINSNSLLSSIENFDKIFDKVIKNQSYLSDVPVGCFLSGGIDSSLVATYMQKNSKKKINTFTIGFEDKLFDESKYSKKIANFIGSNHNEYILKKKDIIEAVNLVPQVYSEPFADSSQLPTILLNKFVKNSGIKVILSGDGGDEMFYGYNRYFYANKILNLQKFLPKFILNYLEKKLIDNKNINLTNLKNKINESSLHDKFFKISNILNSDNIDEIYNKLISNPFKKNIFLNDERLSDNSIIFKFDPKVNNIDQMSYFDKNSYLHDDILCKVDRASMFYSIETRCPFLDIDIINFSENLDSKHKTYLFSGKKILKKTLSKFLPKNLYERPKMGFGIPLKNLIKNELIDFSETMLSEKLIKDSSIFEFDEIKTIWNNHKKGHVNSHYTLWPILMFQSWYYHNK
jgi:asparagine synthase (glutamine-hydrolysing)